MGMGSHVGQHQNAGQGQAATLPGPGRWEGSNYLHLKRCYYSNDHCKGNISERQCQGLVQPAWYPLCKVVKTPHLPFHPRCPAEPPAWAAPTIVLLLIKLNPIAPVPGNTVCSPQGVCAETRGNWGLLCTLAAPLRQNPQRNSSKQCKLGHTALTHLLCVRHHLRVSVIPVLCAGWHIPAALHRLLPALLMQTFNFDDL